MSHSLMWAAMKGAPVETFLENAELIDTGEPDAFFEAEIAGAEHPGGWYVVVASDPAFADAAALARWSQGARLIAAVIDEDTLTSLVTEWREGRPVWSIAHEAAGGEPQLSVDGDVPELLHPVREEMLARANGVATPELAYEIPLEVAARITGFRHDALGFEEDGPQFTVLEPE
jgi:hypothetical protein